MILQVFLKLNYVNNELGLHQNRLAMAEGGLRRIQDILVKMKSKTMEAIGDMVGQDESTAVLGQL